MSVERRGPREGEGYKIRAFGSMVTKETSLVLVAGLSLSQKGEVSQLNDRPEEHRVPVKLHKCYSTHFPTQACRRCTHPT